MLRGIFMPAGVTKDQVDFYVDLFKKVRETADWKKFMEDGAFNTTFMAGAEYAKWVEGAENTHKTLMKEAGFLATVTLAPRPAEQRRARAPGRRGSAPPYSRSVAGDSMSDQDTAERRGRHFDAHDGDRRRAGAARGQRARRVRQLPARRRSGATTARNRATSRSTSDSCSASRASRRCAQSSLRSGGAATSPRRAAAPASQFVAWGQLKLVLSVLVPAFVYVLGVQLIGIYVASAVYITLFMRWLGHYPWAKSAAIGVARQRVDLRHVRGLVQGPAVQGRLRRARVARLLSPRR